MGVEMVAVGVNGVVVVEGGRVQGGREASSLRVVVVA